MKAWDGTQTVFFFNTHRLKTWLPGLICIMHLLYLYTNSWLNPLT